MAKTKSLSEMVISSVGLTAFTYPIYSAVSALAEHESFIKELKNPWNILIPVIMGTAYFLTQGAIELGRRHKIAREEREKYSEKYVF